MHTRRVRIVSTGLYVPSQVISDVVMDQRLGTPPGWVSKTTEVANRHFANDIETNSYMGAKAAQAALESAGLRFADIDCLVCASGTREQILPSTASLIQEALGEGMSGVPAFDLDATCLSFVVALDTMSYLVDAGRYRRVLLVSSEIASVGLDWTHKESAALFGDGAAAVIIERSEEGSSHLINGLFRTYSVGAHLSEVRGGGTRMPARHYEPKTDKDYLFQMNGQAIFKLASKLMPDFVTELMAPTGLGISDVQLVVPHQGSAMATRLLRKKLGIAAEQMVNIIPMYGNTIAASIPMGLHHAIHTGLVQRGDRLLLIGTAAGLSLGGLLLEY